MVIPFLLGFLLSGAIVLLSLRFQFLTIGGGFGALLIGTLVFASGGLPWAFPLLLFFFSSSLLSKVGIRRKERAYEIFEKGGKRDLFQVLANGGIPALLSILNFFNYQLPITSYYLFLGSLAAANSDTWGTEIGLLSRMKPISLKNLKKVEPGSSGGITPLGLLASLIGAILISLFSLPHDSNFSFIITGAGFLGSLFDSLLGGTFQAQYRCPVCGKITEKRTHCNHPTSLEGGLSWLNNDLVNLFATLSGAFLTLLGTVFFY